MNTIYNTNKFDKKMKQFKKHTKVITAIEPDSSYFMTGSDERFDFLDYSEYDPAIFCRPAEFFQNIIINNFFQAFAPKEIYYTEAWKSDPDRDFYIRLVSIKDDGDTGLFEVWHYYEVAQIEVTLITNPYGDLPELIRVRSLEHINHYENKEEIA